MKISYTNDVIGQVTEEKEASKRACGDNDRVVNELNPSNIKKLELRFNHTEIEGCQEIECPDKKAPKTKLNGERISETIGCLRFINRELGKRKHDQANI